MKQPPIQIDPANIPDAFRPLLRGAQTYDSSCSESARVLFIDRDGGYYLKSAPRGSLEQEARMTAYFHGKGLAPEVLTYTSEERDWLLTAKAPGTDCTDARYLENPERLCDTLAELLRRLHSVDASDCPIPNRMLSYRETAETNYRTGNFDNTHFPDNWGYATAEDAWQVVQRDGHLLKTDTLLHGDYCLPNVLLNDWKFGAFIDVGNGGVGDRHIDLFWGVWSLSFNLKTDRYSSRFLDAYGRANVETDALRLVAAFEVFG